MILPFLVSDSLLLEINSPSFSWGETHWTVTHSFLLFHSPALFRNNFVLLTRSCVPTWEAAVEIVLRRFPLYHVAIATVMGKLRYYSSLRGFLSCPRFELSFSNQNQWAPGTEGASTQPASIRTVEWASQASRTSHRSDRKSLTG